MLMREWNGPISRVRMRRDLMEIYTSLDEILSHRAFLYSPKRWVVESGTCVWNNVGLEKCASVFRNVKSDDKI